MVFFEKVFSFLEIRYFSGENLLGTYFVHNPPLSTSPNFFKAPSHMLYEFWFIIDDIIFPTENFFFSIPLPFVSDDSEKKTFCEYMNPKLSIIIILIIIYHPLE